MKKKIRIYIKILKIVNFMKKLMILWSLVQDVKILIQEKLKIFRYKIVKSIFNMIVYHVYQDINY